MQVATTLYLIRTLLMNHFIEIVQILFMQNPYYLCKYCSISKSRLNPKRTINVKFVRLLASKFRAKCDLLLREHHCSYTLAQKFRFIQLVVALYKLF